MLAARHSDALKNIIKLFEKSGYNVTYKLLNTSDFGIPQDRRRVIFVGYRKDLKLKYIHPESITSSQDEKLTLKDAIWDLRKNALPGKEKNKSNLDKCKVSNHEYMIGGFSTIFMSRNRVRAWDEQSFTIQAGGRHAPIHPQAPEMIFVEKNKRIFVAGKEKLYRRLSVRECARIQSFPDWYIFQGPKTDQMSLKYVYNDIFKYTDYILVKKTFNDHKLYLYPSQHGSIYNLFLSFNNCYLLTMNSI